MHEDVEEDGDKEAKERCDEDGEAGERGKKPGKRDGDGGRNERKNRGETERKKKNLIGPERDLNGVRKGPAGIT